MWCDVCMFVVCVYVCGLCFFGVCVFEGVRYLCVFGVVCVLCVSV